MKATENVTYFERYSTKPSKKRTELGAQKTETVAQHQKRADWQEHAVRMHFVTLRFGSTKADERDVNLNKGKKTMKRYV
jgi:hypothetical protein